MSIINFLLGERSGGQEKVGSAGVKFGVRGMLRFLEARKVRFSTRWIEWRDQHGEIVSFVAAFYLATGFMWAVLCLISYQIIGIPTGGHPSVTAFLAWMMRVGDPSPDPAGILAVVVALVLPLYLTFSLQELPYPGESMGSAVIEATACVLMLGAVVSWSALPGSLRAPRPEALVLVSLGLPALFGVLSFTLQATPLMLRASMKAAQQAERSIELHRSRRGLDVEDGSVVQELEDAEGCLQHAEAGRRRAWKSYLTRSFKWALWCLIIILVVGASYAATHSGSIFTWARFSAALIVVFVGFALEFIYIYSFIGFATEGAISGTVSRWTSLFPAFSIATMSLLVVGVTVGQGLPWAALAEFAWLGGPFMLAAFRFKRDEAQKIVRQRLNVAEYQAMRVRLRAQRALQESELLNRDTGGC